MARRKEETIADELKRCTEIFSIELTSSLPCEEIERRCRRSGVLFIDATFPPCFQSLYITNDTCDDANLCAGDDKDIVWKRPAEFIRGNAAFIFEGKIEPNDIKQGALGRNDSCLNVEHNA